MTDTIDLNSPEVKEAIQTAVDAEVKNLKANRDEVLSELKKLRKESGIKPEDLEAVEKERDDFKTQLLASQKTLKEVTGKAELSNKALEAETVFTQKLVLENALVNEFMQAGVKDPDFLDLLKAKHLPMGKVVVDGDTRKAMFGDKTINDYVKEWALTDAAKKTLAATNNSGGGAQGGGSNQNSKTMTRAQFDAADQGTRSAFAKDGGKVTD